MSKYVLMQLELGIELTGEWEPDVFILLDKIIEQKEEIGKLKKEKEGKKWWFLFS